MFIWLMVWQDYQIDFDGTKTEKRDASARAINEKRDARARALHARPVCHDYTFPFARNYDSVHVSAYVRV